MGWLSRVDHRMATATDVPGGSICIEAIRRCAEFWATPEIGVVAWRKSGRGLNISGSPADKVLGLCGTEVPEAGPVTGVPSYLGSYTRSDT